MDENTDKELEREVERQYNILKFGVVEITPENDFKAMLYDSIKNNRPLRVKCGIDPTGSDVHLGHTVPYRKMRQFQDLGHIGVVIIGDYTAMIGDPTGRNESRKSLTRQEVKINAQKYMDQVYKVIDPAKTEVHFQSSWFEEFSLSDVISWAAQTTVAKLISHETFKNRLDSGNPLSLHEMFYPVLQGIDSVYVNADIELGGTDQKFNVLMGRDYQKNKNQRPQVAMLLPIITGTCGTAKMSKSLNNYIGIQDDPFDQFGKVMSIPDEIMVEYYKYIANLTQEEFLDIESKLRDGAIHPNEAKKQLASLVVSFFYGAEVGMAMRKQFESVFAKGKVPDDAYRYIPTDKTLLASLMDTEMFKSNGEVRRLLKQNAVGIVEGDKLTDENLIIDKSFIGKVIKVGKRKFIKLVESE